MGEGGDDGGAAAKSRLLFFGRIAVSLFIFFVISRFVDLGAVFEKIKLVSPWLWAAVFIGFIGGHLIAAAKWRMLIGGAIDYRRAVRAHFAGLAANLMLPGVAGGDIVRAGLVMKGSDRKTSLAIASLTDRLIDTGVLLVISAIGAALMGARAGVNPTALFAASLSLILIAIASIAFVRPIARLVRQTFRAGKLAALAARIADALDDIGGRPGALAICAVLSLLTQAGFAMMNGLIASDLGANTSLAAWLFAWPLAKLVATLPISFGGLGVREASLASLMSPLGYASSGVVAASLVWQSIQFAAGFLGGAMQMTGRGPKATYG